MRAEAVIGHQAPRLLDAFQAFLVRDGRRLSGERLERADVIGHRRCGAALPAALSERWNGVRGRGRQG